MRTKLPISNSLLKLKINKNACKEILKKSLHNKNHYDKRTLPKDQLSVSDKVFMQQVKKNMETWHGFAEI